MFYKFTHKTVLVILLVLLSLFALPTGAYAVSTAGARDHPLFKRPNGYRIVDYFSGDRAMTISMEDRDVNLSGRLTEIFYYTKGKPLSASALGYRFLSALGNAGGEVVFEENLSLGGRRIAGRLNRDNRAVWVIQDVTGLREYKLSILEAKDPSKSDVVRGVPTRELETEAEVLELLYTVDRVGKLEFPAKFKAGGSVLQKGYESDFRKFAMLLDKDASLVFRVDTYTDTSLKPAEQRPLLRERTAAIIEAMIASGADRARLKDGTDSGLGATQDDAPRETAPRGVRLTLIKPSAMTDSFSAQPRDLAK
ncbi:hypothetical protein AGMMS50276_01230 [Synergistales bacterium]|nr:hypothetical protein AGMMS50276_01230 [Synergistales bacterium]